ncbi:Histidine biosynthesis bifunctional protein hisB [Nowakowskiella sp. JEL0407]|nr:Histidine biosynthesis bifunctional protein hisB [Nowakowskiella sp. JEL0407]
MSKCVHILDYGAGNVLSLVNAVKKLGYDIKYVESAEDLLSAERLLFPGVGAFGAAMSKLHSSNYTTPLKQYIASGRPFMGICVGLQSLCLGSEEDPGVDGLGLIPTIVKKFNSTTKSVPHMGWNSATVVQSDEYAWKQQENGTLVAAELNHDSNPDSTKYYFVHSYAVPFSKELEGWTYSVTRYGDELFVSSVRKGNVFATQFHPEKSGFAGLKVLRTFLSAPVILSAPAASIVTDPNLVKDKFTRRIIACLDVRTNDSGDLVVTKGDQYDVRERSDGNVRNLGKPVDLARQYFEEGADEITFLNITSFRDCPVRDLPMLEVLRRSSESIFVPLTIGGGIRDIVEPDGTKVSALEVAGMYFRSGADKVSIGSDAVYAVEEYLKLKSERSDPLTGKTAIEQISKVYGSQAVVISVDPKRVYVNSPSDTTHRVLNATIPGPNGEKFCWYQCTVKGGREGRDIDVYQLVTVCEALGAGEILLNCMDRDGTNSGYELELVSDVKNSVKIPVIASSGAGNPDHFREVFDTCKVEAALAAGIFHRREVPIEEVKRYLKLKGMEIRGVDAML